MILEGSGTLNYLCYHLLTDLNLRSITNLISQGDRSSWNSGTTPGRIRLLHWAVRAIGGRGYCVRSGCPRKSFPQRTKQGHTQHGPRITRITRDARVCSRCATVSLRLFTWSVTTIFGSSLALSVPPLARGSRPRSPRSPPSLFASEDTQSSATR